jgi:hypothetical protein
MLWKDLSQNFEKVIPQKYYKDILQKELTPIEEESTDMQMDALFDENEMQVKLNPEMR